MTDRMAGYARRLGSVCVAILAITRLGAAEPAIDLSLTKGAKHIYLPLIPAVDQFKVLRTRDLGQPFTLDASGSITGYEWTEPGQSNFEFYRLEILPKNPNDVLVAHVLNRLAYGPTPDELARVKQIGADAYIREQLEPEKIEEDLPIDRIVSSDDWQYVTVTGRATSSKIYIYPTVIGDVYVDDIKLVPGSVPEAGQNLLLNGGFENGLTGWTVSMNLTNSLVTTEVKHGGLAALHMISTDEGNSEETAIWREDLRLTQNATYTLSYWYKAGTNRNTGLTIRLSGSGIVSTPDVSPDRLATRLAEGTAELPELTAWHALHAIQSKKQLLETTLQFLENHFVTQESKSQDYLERFYDDDEEDFHATNLEYRELQRWRAALLSPQCTFHDLLKISAESPAMIIYLDTVNSRGDGQRIANENYARELLELFTFGVDNGYHQEDITVLSRIWTGWSTRLVDPTNEFNPFALQTKKLLPFGTNENTIDNLDGIWAFGYKPETHYIGEKVLFPGATVPVRFGPPYAGRNYEFRTGGAPRGTNWQFVTMTGTASSSTLYIYATGTGDCYIDDVKIVPGRTAEVGTNAVRNGSFESGLTGWTISSNLLNSKVSTDVKYSGTRALHLVSTEAGESRTNSIYRRDLGLVSRAPYTLSYWYKPGTNLNGSLIIRLSNSGIVGSPGGGTNSVQEGYEVLAHLADQPFTQEFISVKLCRLFVHDDFALGYDFTDPNLSPEGRLVRACMEAWENSTPKGQIRKVLEVIFNSELFRSQDGSMQKVKTPFEFTVSAIRALRGRTTNGEFTADSNGMGIVSPLNRMGRMRLFDRDDPDGYPESGAPWISAGTLSERLRFVQALLIASTAGGRGDANGNTTDPVKLLKDRLPSSAWNNAGAVVDFFLELIYPGEGKANLDEARRAAIDYLNTADNGINSSPFSSVVNTGVYDTRVRGMVATLMSFQRFQEQ